MTKKAHNADLPFSGSYRRLDVADIETFEAKNGLRLPESYKQFLLLTNGGQPKTKNALDIPSWPHKSTVINYFFGIDTGDTYDLVDNMRAYEGRAPKHCFPIADDVPGNMLCIELTGPGEGNVYFWDHENESDHPSYANMYLVANDVFELLDKLYVE